MTHAAALSLGKDLARRGIGCPSLVRHDAEVEHSYSSNSTTSPTFLGNMRVDQIAGADVLKILRPVWGTRQERARRVRQRIRTVLGWALAHGHVCPGNPRGRC